ncbi:hypothetical protein N8510_01200 [bacterium]|nr:hypothetical protein [bacterium]
MATDLEKGAFAGKDTFLYYNSATYASPTWVEMVRSRNVQVTRGAATTEVEFHGASTTGNIHGYSSFSGSFEYVKRLGTDAVFAALEAARDNKTIVDIIHLNGPETLPASSTADPSVGWRAPVILGEFSETSNGSDSVTVTIPFVKADAYTAAGVAVDITDYTGS